MIWEISAAADSHLALFLSLLSVHPDWFVLICREKQKSAVTNFTLQERGRFYEAWRVFSWKVIFVYSHWNDNSSLKILTFTLEEENSRDYETRINLFVCVVTGYWLHSLKCESVWESYRQRSQTPSHEREWGFLYRESRPAWTCPASGNRTPEKHRRANIKSQCDAENDTSWEKSEVVLYI